MDQKTLLNKKSNSSNQEIQTAPTGTCLCLQSRHARLPQDQEATSRSVHQQSLSQRDAFDCHLFQRCRGLYLGEHSIRGFARKLFGSKNKVQDDEINEIVSFETIKKQTFVTTEHSCPLNICHCGRARIRQVVNEKHPGRERERIVLGAAQHQSPLLWSCAMSRADNEIRVRRNGTVNFPVDNRLHRRLEGSHPLLSPQSLEKKEKNDESLTKRSMVIINVDGIVSKKNGSKRDEHMSFRKFL